MKKFNEFELIGIGVTLLVLCILISLIGKHVFDLTGDYLTSSTTLFAALVALFLYSDWREQHTIVTLDKKQDEISKASDELTDAYLSLVSSLINNVNKINNDLSLREAMQVMTYKTEKMEVLLNLYMLHLEVFQDEATEHREEIKFYRDGMTTLSTFLIDVSGMKQDEKITVLKAKLWDPDFTAPISRMHEVCRFHMLAFNHKVLKGEIKAH